MAAAGLGDREFIIAHASVLAQAMCARLAVAPPHMILAASANKGYHKIECRWRWSRYFNMSGLPYVADWVLPARGCQRKDKALQLQQQMASMSGLVNVSSANEAFGAFVRREPFSFTVSAGDFRAKVLHTPSCRHLIADLQVNGCSLPRFTPSSIALQAAASFVGSFGAGGFVSLHVRRGDSVGLGCSTAPQHLKLLLNCRLGQHNGTLPAIVLFTDERDPAYVADVLAMLRTFAVVAVHGDAALLSLLVNPHVDPHVDPHGNEDPAVDNYLLFVASAAAKATATLHLEFGGHRDGMGRVEPTLAEHCDRVVRCRRNSHLFLKVEPNGGAAVGPSQPHLQAERHNRAKL